MRVSLLCWALTLLACGGDGTGPVSSGSEAVDVVRSCSIPPVPGAAQVNLATDVTYATMGGQPVRLDVAWPRTGTATRPIVLVFHGGAWSDGDKTAQRGDILLLAERGFVAASVNYRLADAPDNTFPAAVADARCAVRWARQHAAGYGGDGSRIAALGYSAGAHLAAMLGTASDVAGLDDACPLGGSPRVERVIAYYGPHDLRPNGSLAGFQQQIIANFLGAPASSVPAEAALASPVVHASADDPPTLLVHGRTDFIVPIESSRLLRDALHDAGARATLVEVGAGHGFGAFTPSLPPSSCTTLAFLDQMRGP